MFSLRSIAALFLLAGCSGGSFDAGSFVATDAPRVETSREVLLREALAGTSEQEEVHLSARMRVTRLPLPATPPGATARFTHRGRPGFVTALPTEELLTSPAFANGKIFLGGGFSSHTFFALDAYSGEMRWAVGAPDGGPSAAIIHEGRVIFNTESCTLFVADAETGRIQWKRWLGDPLMSQPAAAGDLVFSAYPANGAHAFGAFRLADGEPVWSVDIPADVIQAPQVQGGSIYFATMDGTAFRLRASDGAVTWKREIGASSAMWADGDDVLLARRIESADGPKEQAIVVDADDGAMKAEGPIEPAPYLGGASRDRELSSGTAGAWGSVPHGEHLGLVNVASGWAFQGSSPAVADGRAYFSVGGSLRARDMRTGQTLWERRYAEAQGAQALSPPAVVQGMLVFGTVDGHVYATDVDTGMTLFAYDVGEPVVFQPVIAQGYLYVTTARGRLIGLEIGDAALDGWHMWGGNAGHTGLVETAGTIDPALVASRRRPTRGAMRLASLEHVEPDATIAEGATGTEVEGEEQPSAIDAPIVNAPEAEPPELPLGRTRVRGSVSGNVARVEVTQEFRNPFDRPIEAVYVFPLPPDAAVDSMEMRIGERVVRARIRRRETARREYTEAREGGRRAALLELDRPGLFAERVANIPPGERIDVRLTYVEELPFDDGEYSLAFPMVAPRRFDPNDTDRVDPLATERSVAAAAQRASGEPRVDIAFDVAPGMPIEAIASPSHRGARIDREEDRAHVALNGVAADRDFVLRFGVSGETPRAALLATRDRERGYFGLVVQPPEAPDDGMIAPRDVVFVVDTSSSMRGRPLEQAKATLRAVLHTLRSEDTFQILAFGDTIERFDPGFVVAEPQAIERAITHVDALRAVGATHMVPAIEAAMREVPQHDRARVPLLVLVSDGYIANEADVMRALAIGLEDVRVYPLGVGAAPNRFLLERAAEIGRGQALIASLGEPPDEVAAKLADRIAAPVFTDIEIDWGGLDVSEVYPRRVPDLFAGKPIVLHGVYGRGGEAEIRVRGTIGGQRLERVLPVSLPETPQPDDAHLAQRTLWARAAIDDRLDRMTFREPPQLVEQVTRLGLAHHIVTPYTSFVAVDDTPRPQPEEDAARTTLSPARALPGDPEIRIRAPRDSLAVTVVLPFGETISASYEPDIDMWSARFLIPRDADEGSYPVIVLITHADGHLERLDLGYTVDATAPLVDLSIEGEPRRGADVAIRARQVITPADLAQTGRRHIDPERVVLLSDANRIELVWNGRVVSLETAAPGVWEARVHIAENAPSVIELAVHVIDMAANVRTQPLRIEVSP